MRITNHYVREYLGCAFVRELCAVYTVVADNLEVFLRPEVPEGFLHLVAPYVVMVIVRLPRRSCIQAIMQQEITILYLTV